jgi:hypothetical protein
MTRTEFNAIAVSMAAIAGKSMPVEQVDGYFGLLRDLPFAAVELAAKRALLESQYPMIPPVGVLRRLASAALAPPDSLWGEAWEQALQAVRRYSLDEEYRALESLPPLVARAARAVGWRALCDSNPANCSTLRAQFRDVYTSFTRREEAEQRLPSPLRAAVAKIAGRIGVLLPPA